MRRWKTVVGPKLKARNFENQEIEVKIGAHILNRMTSLGRPHFERISRNSSREGRVPTHVRSLRQPGERSSLRKSRSVQAYVDTPFVQVSFEQSERVIGAVICQASFCNFHMLRAGMD